MTAWDEYSEADFNARLAPKGAAKRAQEAAQTGQAGLFFTPTPVARPATRQTPAQELPGQEDMFADQG